MKVRRTDSSESEPSRPGLKRERRRLLFITITFHPEPGALRGLPLARRLVESGDYEVTVLTAFPWYPLGHVYPGYRQRPWKRERIDGVDVVRVPLYPSHDSSAARRMLTYISFMASALFIGLAVVGRADVVYHVDNLPTTGIVALLYGRIRNAPVVQHVGDLWPESVTESGMLPRGLFGRGIGALLRKVCDAVYHRDAKLTVLSPGFKNILVARGIPEERVDVLYNWAEEDRFFPVRYDERLATDLGFAGKFNVVYAGNIGPLQALATVVRAAGLLTDAQDIQIVIIGGGPQADAIERLARELGVHNVKFLGRRPIEEMNAINGISDALLVHLADREFLHSTIPSKVQVALASAKPILLGVRGDAAELLQRSGAGFAFAPEDPGDLARVIRELAALPPAERAAKGQRGRKYYEEHLSLEVGVRRMSQIFRDIRVAS